MQDVVDLGKETNARSCPRSPQARSGVAEHVKDAEDVVRMAWARWSEGKQAPLPNWKNGSTFTNWA